MQNNDVIKETRFFILRTNSYNNGINNYVSMTTNTPENRYLHVKTLGYDEFYGESKIKIHTFEENTLHFVISGKGFFDGAPIESGGGFMVRKNHIAEYEPDAENPWTYCYIDFDGEIAQKLLDMVGLVSDKCTFTSQSNSKIMSIIKSALQYDYSKADVDMHLSAVLLEIFAHMLADKPEPFSNVSLSVTENRVKSGIEYINEHYMEKNCIEKLAKAQKINRRYLSRLFKRYSDRSPQEHLIKVRIDEAKKLLRTTRISVSAVGSKVGYDDVMQFSKIFKKYTGVSPTEYRMGTVARL